MARILIIDDDRNLGRTVEHCLKRDGHQCYLAHSGSSGLVQFTQYNPDAIILDLMLPDVDGLEVCDRLREINIRQGKAPPLILMLTAKAERIDRVIGYSKGAVAYLSKPFELDELSAQLRALLTQFRLQKENEKWETIETCHFQINSQYQQIKVRPTSKQNWVSLECSALEVGILHTLASRPGRVWDRDQLMNAAWEDGSGTSDRAVDSHITRLRKKLAAVLGDRQPFIITVRSVGYKFEDNHD